jgi:hypothetical protein
MLKTGSLFEKNLLEKKNISMNGRRKSSRDNAVRERLTHTKDVTGSSALTIRSLRLDAMNGAVIALTMTRAMTAWFMFVKKLGTKNTRAMKVLTTVDTLLKVSLRVWERQSCSDITKTRKAKRLRVLSAALAKT